MSVIEYHPKPRKTRFKQTLRSETQKTLKWLITTLSLMIIFLGIAFFVFTNQNAQKGYALEQAKLKNESLKTINNQISAKITDSTAFTEIEDTEQLDVMEEVIEKEFVTEEDNKIWHLIKAPYTYPC